MHRFGFQIGAIVDVCTELPHQPGQSWRDHKLAYLSQVVQATQSAQCVVLADKLCNVRSLLTNLGPYGNDTWNHFTTSWEDYLWFYRSLAAIFEQALPVPLTNEFSVVFRTAAIQRRS